jgi:hypothetical protein
MAGLVPAIHVFLSAGSDSKEHVDARDKRGHDAVATTRIKN